MSLRNTLRHWLGGIRLYIAAGIVLLTYQLWHWNAITYKGNSELLASHLHESFGWVALIWLTAALAIGPAYRLFPKLPAKLVMRDARRMLGIGAAWFASLHAGVAYIVSFQAANPLSLAPYYQKGMLLGAFSLIILLSMAFTSFDGAMRTMGPWWFKLHRLIYAGAILAIWHAMSIGVHATGIPALISVVGASVILFVMHIQVVLRQEKPITELQILSLCLVGVAIIILSNYGLQLHLDQYAGGSR